MSELAGSDVPASRASPAWPIPLALILLLGLFPPETRGEALAAAAGLIAALALLTWRRPDFPLLLPLLALLAAAAPLALTAEAPGAAVEPLALAGLAVALGLYVTALDDRERLCGLVVLALAAAGALVGLHAAYQKLWGLASLATQLGPAGDTTDGAAMLARLHEGRAFAAFTTPAALGGYMALVLPITVAAAIARRGIGRLGLIAAAALQLGGLVAAASATATAALLGALALAVARWPAARTALIRVAALVVVLLAVVVALRGQALVDPSGGDSPWRLRAANFRLAAAIAGDHPWSGVGPGGFAEAYPRYRQPGDNETRHAHNLPLELAAELGLPAGVLLTLLFGVLFVGPLARSLPDAPAERRGIAIGLAAFALHSLTDFTAFMPSVLWTAAILRGVLARAGAGDAPPVLVLARRVPAGIALTGTLFAASVAGLSGLAANARLGAVEAVMRGDPAVALERASRATRLAPWEIDGWLLSAQVPIQGPFPAGPDRKALAASLDAVDHAVMLSPVRPYARHLRSRLRLALGDTPGAYADAQSATRLYPLREEYARARRQLAEVLSAVGRPGASR